MSKAIIDESTLTSLADKIRILNGIEDTMTPDEMNSELTNTNVEVDAQSALIDQLSELLDGKSAGGGSSPEWLPLDSLPSTYAIEEPEDGSGPIIYYLELANNFKAVLFRSGINSSIINATASVIKTSSPNCDINSSFVEYCNIVEIESNILQITPTINGIEYMII